MRVTYEVNFGTGAGNRTAKTLEEAKKIADDCAAYTQCDIAIYAVTDDDRIEIAQRKWYGLAPSADDKKLDIIQFGHHGYYGQWSVDQWFENTSYTSKCRDRGSEPKHSR